MKPISFDFNLPPREAIDYLEGKGQQLSFHYDEIMHESHHTAFTVAKVTRLDLLSDIHDSIIRAQRDGIPFEQWKKDLAPTLKQYGWWGQISVADPKTGEPKDIYVGSRRLRTIFDTNMRVSYSVGRHKQMMGLTDSLYWRYSAVLDSRTRPGHAAKNGIILHRDDPWWKINYPPNAWNCRCKVRAYSMDDLKAKGWEVSESAHENIASADWAYDVGAGSRVGKLTKMELDKSLLSTLPKVSEIRKAEYDLLTELDLEQKFFDDLGITSGTVYIDRIGDPTLIDNEIFKSGNFNKIKKQDRHLFVDEFAKTISDPDEIWLEYDDKAKRIVKKMLRYLSGDGGGKRALIAVFEYKPDKTQGVSLYFVKDSGQVENKRGSKLVYQKGQE